MSPILKEGGFEEPGNNRPISLLPILSKVCEKVASEWRWNRAEKKWHSTETSLIVSMDTILEVVDKRKLTAIVYLDIMSKVFNSINHNILLQKLKAIWLARHQWSPGLTANCLKDVKWFALMLPCLTLYLWGVECHKVAYLHGTLLFSIYVNNIPSVIETCSTVCYLDDKKEILSFMRVVHSLNFIRLLQVVITPSVASESTGR